MSGSRSVAVIGAGGFVGSAVAEALARRGADVRRVRAPRLSTSARSLEELSAEPHSGVEALAEELEGSAAIVLCAGVADAVRGGSDALYGANAELPGFVAAALDRLDPRPRLVHVSSAAVQGRTRRLDETTDVAPFSPYSHAKALGEQVLHGRPDTVLFRPTSVHGPGRDVTRRLARFLGSPLASVAGAGDRPTPQVLVANVADAIAFVALSERPPPAVVLQPAEGLTTASLVRVVGGREPRHLPPFVTRATVSVMMLVGRRSGRVAGLARRLEVLWFGQAQVEGWLTRAGWQPVAGPERWQRIGREVR